MKPQSKDTSFHWIIGVVLLLCGSILCSVIVASYSGGQGTNDLSNANVNVNNELPLINGFQLFHDNGGITTLALGAEVPGIIGGSVNIILNVNVTDKNGFDYGTSAISHYLRLVRTTNTDGVHTVNTEGETSFYDVMFNASNAEERKLPMATPSTCAPVSYYDSGAGTNTGVLIRCITPIHYLSDPTSAASSTNATTTFEASRWEAVFRFTDRAGAEMFDTSSIYFEYPNILGLSVDTSVDLGRVTTDGTPSALASATVSNRGNQQLDIAMEVNKQTDSTAWTCVGGYPLVSDIHTVPNGGNENYALMTPLTLNVAGSGTQETAFNLQRASVRATPSTKTEGFKFATTRPIYPGFCTLSAIILTALKGY